VTFARSRIATGTEQGRVRENRLPAARGRSVAKLLHIIITCPMAGHWQSSPFDRQSKTQGAPRNSVCVWGSPARVTLLCTGSSVSWVANVALPLQDLQNGYSSMYLWCAARWPRSEDRRDRRWPPLRVPFLASKKGDCIVHTPSQSWKCCWPTRAEGRSTEVVGNEMQTTKAHVQDSQAKVSACCDLPCSGCARSSASPNRWNHAGARHVILSTLSQRASPSNKPVVF
jgi:hypothetical protein